MTGTSFTKLLKGWDFPPITVGMVRGVIEAVVLGALGGLNQALGVLDWGQFAIQGGFAGVICLILWHYVKVLIPKLHEEHRAEREAMMVRFDAMVSRFDTVNERLVADCKNSRIIDRQEHAQESLRNDAFREAAVALIIKNIEDAVSRATQAKM